MSIEWFCHKLAQVNLFDEVRNNADNSGRILQLQLRSTRLYIFLLIVILVLLTTLRLRETSKISISIPNPSISDYQELENTYAKSLSCPCKQIAFSYASFVMIKPSFHQVRMFLR